MLLAKKDYFGALASFEKALEINVRLAKQAPDNPNIHYRLAITHEKIGSIQQERRGWALALESCQQALEIAKRFVQKQPEDPAWLNQVLVGYSGVGDCLAAQNEISAAETAYENARRVCEHLTAAFPDEGKFQIDVAASKARFCRLRIQTGNYAAAEKLIREGIQHLDTIERSFIPSPYSRNIRNILLRYSEMISK